VSQQVRLTAADGHELEAYVATPSGEPIAGLVVVQEIFGVNQHIRSIADGYAKDGFLAISPALFDRYERGVELGYEGADAQKARSFLSRLDIDAAVRDTAAALDYVRSRTGKKSGVIGYCFGGTIAWLAATRLNSDAAVGYYGGRIAMFANEQPNAPSCCTSAQRTSTFPGKKSTQSPPRTPTLRFSGTTRATASTAMPVQVSTPNPRNLPAHVRLSFSPEI
jgi:carboxymethylenebutenolidase